ncbi:copper amine oxidase N-terminal domain-containing protein [Paenibacillus sp. TRM 82003]|nr:copper amine oxidase N-terminal domain-containing protein [Paenibacillus sp. TRM 82003]
MNKWKSMLAVTTVCSMLSAGAAQAAEQEMKVLIEGQPAAFQPAPFVSDGTTLVPFRALFEALGLTVEWKEETRTVLGSGEGVELQLQLDSKTAVVNGQEIALSAAPRSVDGSTFVPLRFVGEATGRLVEWADATRTITVHAAPVAYDFESYYKGFVKATNAEDLDGVMSYIHPESPLFELLEAEVSDSFEKYDVVTELKGFEVIDAKANEATLHTVESNVNTSDAFYMDTDVQVVLTVVRDEAGEWKIYNVQVADLKYKITEEELTAEADVDASLKTALLGVVEENINAAEAEDLDMSLATIDAAAREQTKASLDFLFATYDLDYEIEVNNVVAASEDEAYVYTMYTMKKVAGPEFTDSRAKAVQVLEKLEDGCWTIAQTHMIGVEPL